LRALILARKICPAGRTLWLGGTEIAKRRESSMFNCAFTEVETVYDIVDVLWLLLQGCGVGFKPKVGTLTGFRTRIKNISIIPSTRSEKGEQEETTEDFDPSTGVWVIKFGDSAEGWAKGVGKILAGKYMAKKLIIDLSEIRPAGERLKGYGWLSCGDAQLKVAVNEIATILNNRADQLLTKMDILDIVNHLGTILSSRRSAQIALFEYGHAEWEEFAVAKKDWWLYNNAHRQQSNNSLLFYEQPSREQLESVFKTMIEAGGSEPGIINAQEAQARAPWFKGCNPCVEILLGNKSFCNLTEVNLLAFKDDKEGLERALYLAGRMNYRQTMVDLRDGILQEAWHLNNDFLHLCGVGLTGIAGRPDLTQYDLRKMRNIAISAAYSMAKELRAPLPKNVTCIKPSGTLSKIMGSEEWGEVSEGVHKPMGRYVFNNITFSKHDPLVDRFVEAGYEIVDKPFEAESVIVKFPVEYTSVVFDETKVMREDGTEEVVEVNLESAVEQLERYKLYQLHWCDQNVSNTISYSEDEVPAIIDWLEANWDSYVGVSFLFRNDPTKTAEDLGYAYLPQEVVSKDAFDNYVQKLKPVDYSKTMHAEFEAEDCEGGHCPVK
jgi:ribonucleoside-triphosphate reductase (formate)